MVTFTSCWAMAGLAGLAGLASAAQQDFNMWPWMSPDTMSLSLDVSPSCLSAMYVLLPPSPVVF